MPKQVTHYKCLVISPSDVDDARDVVVKAVAEWNAHTGEALDVKLEAVRWESHTYPSMGGAPQEIINRQIVDGCDFGIAVFWTRLGSPTKDHPSGSVEEIERLLARNANVMVYFCDAPVPQTAMRDNQFKRLQQIKRDFQQRGLYSSYEDLGLFRQLLPLHINGLMNNLLLQHRAAGQPIPSQGTLTAPRPDIRVTVTSAILSRGDTDFAGIVVEVQNHSPNDFYFASLLFRRSDGMQVFFKTDFANGWFLTPRTIEPGNCLTFTVDPVEYAPTLEGHEPTVVVARDKIGRDYASPVGELNTAASRATSLIDFLSGHVEGNLDGEGP